VGTLQDFGQGRLSNWTVNDANEKIFLNWHFIGGIKNRLFFMSISIRILDYTVTIQLLLVRSSQ